MLLSQDPYLQLSEDFTASMLMEPAYHERILNMLRSADIGVVEGKSEEQEISPEEFKKHLPPALFAKMEKQDQLKGNKTFSINLAHKSENKEPVFLDYFNEESVGTKKFFSLIGPWIDLLENGYTVIIDEIETSLHPILVKELIRLAYCSVNNPVGAQVIFATHNPILLDGELMRRDQIWFTEKSPAGSTHLYPLTDYQPRKDEALARGYLAGRYGAIPYLPEGLKL
jgi:AAA15 family ATPase/GTPase